MHIPVGREQGHKPRVFCAALRQKARPLQKKTLRLLSRPEAEIRAQAERLAPGVDARLALHGYAAEACACASQIGSGALPVDTIPSAGLRLTGAGGDAPDRLAARLRALPLPVIGHVRDGALILDLRCLDRDADLLEALGAL